MQAETSRWFATSAFEWGEMPVAEVIVIVKHLPDDAWWRALPNSSRVVFCPVDRYGSVGEIEQEYAHLRRCRRIVVHCERLRKYFASYAAVEYVDHHVKFVPDSPLQFSSDGPILWIGVRSNLAPLADWVNLRPLPRPLWILTNPEGKEKCCCPATFGFVNDQIRIERWSPTTHLEWLQQAAAALDIKGDDFRQRHKPPAKAIDFVAAGLPLAMNAGTSSAEHLARLGFDLPDPADDYWLTQDYWQQTRTFGAALRELLSRERVGRRWRNLICDVLKSP